MLLGKVFKNISHKYKLINFNNIRFNSKDCKLNDIFLQLMEIILMGMNI